MKAIALSAKLSLDVVLIWSVIGVAWTILFLVCATGHIHLLHYSIFQETAVSLLVKLLLFLLSWQVMTIAMMLPSSLPLMQLFAQILQKQESKSHFSIFFVFLLAYLLIWSGFAVIAFLGAFGVHFLLNSGLYLQQNQITSIALILAGLFQFSELKEYCLKACRHPLSFLHHHYQRGLKGAWNLGIHHGLYCLGCCWALMLVMLVVGVGHLAWMLLLTGIMTIEKTQNWGQILASLVGVGFIFCGVINFFYPLI